MERGFLFYGTFATRSSVVRAICCSCLFCVAADLTDGIIHDYLESNHSAFFQDDWKVNNRLTLNLGVRWEYDGTYSDKYGNLTNLWVSQFNRSCSAHRAHHVRSGPGRLRCAEQLYFPLPESALGRSGFEQQPSHLERSSEG